MVCLLGEEPPPWERYTPLTFAIEIGNHDVIKELAKKSSPNFGGNGNAIIKATEKGDREIVEILESYGF